MNFIVFPGQGSQKIGMGRDLSDNFVEAREVFEEVNEAYTTQRCSNCQDIPDSSPKGMSALGVAEHDGFFRTKTTQGERDD